MIYFIPVRFDWENKIRNLTGRMLACIALLVAVNVCAQNEPQAIAPSGELPGLMVEEQGENDLRDPFWPVGYVPEHKKKNVVAEQETVIKDEEREEALAALRLGGIGIVKRGEQYYASISGVMLQAGEVIAVSVDDKVFRFMIRSIDLKRVRIELLRR